VSVVRILVTNDDGIDSLGLHALARAMRRHGDVVVVAPDDEYSGASSALGALHLIQPVVHECRLDGLDKAYSMTGPPALCVMFARLGAFGPPPDLVVAGINPGNNVGRSIYHSGTVGAALTARNGGIPGVAISQAVAGWGVEGQGWDEMVANQEWDTAAAIADVVVEGLLADPPADPPVININVPDCPLDEIKGWRLAEVGMRPPRSMATAVLEPRKGHEGSYTVRMDWGEPTEVHATTDVGLVMDGYVAVSWLSRIVNDAPPSDKVGVALDALLG
jgi:5'-nucleotidase